MGIRLFPNRFLSDEACFGIFRTADAEAIELPITILGEGTTPLHVVHSDPDHLAALAGMLVMQAWVFGIDELELPPISRKPLLLITDYPRRFEEAYLKLDITKDGVDRIWSERRKALAVKRNRATNPKDKIERLDKAVRSGSTHTKLHNLFPAKHFVRLDAKLRPIASREGMGRGDSRGAAVVIVRAARQVNLKVLEERFQPFLVLIDADAVAVPESHCELPTLVYHDSIFAPELTSRTNNGQLVVCCLPDAKFETFCSKASLRVVEPNETDDVTKLWQDVDGALFSLMEQSDIRNQWVLKDVCRTASRLRTILLSLFVGIESYEQAMTIAQVPQSFSYQWTVTEPLDALRGRLPEIGAVGEWEEYAFSELLCSLSELAVRLRADSPKRAAVLETVAQRLDAGRSVALVAQSAACAEAMKWLVRLPAPIGLGLDHSRVNVLETNNLRFLQPDQDCILSHAFDPYDLLPTLARIGPRAITVILLKNELRFLGERFLRTKTLFPGHPSQNNLLRPIYERVEKLPSLTAPAKPQKRSSLFTDADFDVVARMFSEGLSSHGYERVLEDENDVSDYLPDANVDAYLLKLEGGRAVYLAPGARLSFIDTTDSLVHGDLTRLEQGDRLILMKPEARETIADRVISAKREEEAKGPAQDAITTWRTELQQGIERESLTYAEILQRIRASGSQVTTSSAIAQWVDGRVLGPQDPNDIKRLGEALGSQWLIENWRKVGAALFMIRVGHRVLGRRVSRIIEAAALGEYSLSEDDEEFLAAIGVSFLQLQDAVLVATVEAIADQPRLVPAYQLGAVVAV
jgi:hypothetical protein